MAQFMMYGSVLNGSLAGYAWGDDYYAGVKRDSGEGHVHGISRWNAHTMGHLKAFMLDDGHDYRTLRPATMTNLVDTDQEWRVLALNDDRSIGLGFIAANQEKTDITGLIHDANYELQWYHLDTGDWSNSKTLSTDGTGKLVLPNKPNANGWAFRIKLTVKSK